MRTGGRSARPGRTRASRVMHSGFVRSSARRAGIARRIIAVSSRVLDPWGDAGLKALAL